MSVLIKGVEMPENCFNCHLKDWDLDNEEFVCSFSEMPASNLCRLDDCPLVEVKTPHGRLIDADALMAEFEKAENAMERHGREFSFSFISSGQEISTEWFAVETMVEDAPTIIEAEE